MTQVRGASSFENASQKSRDINVTIIFFLSCYQNLRIHVPIFSIKILNMFNLI